MKKNIIFISFIIFFIALSITPYKVSATCNIYNASGSGIEQESIDKCLTEQRRLDQQARDQQLLQQQNYSNSLEQNALRTLQLLEQQNTQPVKSNDQICNDKFGQNWKWDGTKNNTGGLNCGCKDGYAQKNGACVTYDQSCNISFPNTVFNKIDINGGRICDCKIGYSWNEQKKGCIITPVVPVKTADQKCSDQFGQNSVSWGGLACGCKDGYIKNNNGQCIPKTNEVALPPGCDSTLYYSSTTGISCDGTNRCGAGSQFNSDKTRCVVIPKVETKITTPVIKKVAEVKAIQNEVKENPVNITKPDSVNLNQEVATNTTTEVKPKGFWARLIGWLGF